MRNIHPGSLKYQVKYSKHPQVSFLIHYCCGIRLAVLRHAMTLDLWYDQLIELEMVSIWFLLFVMAQ
jgi:hypothetical protein